MKYCQPLVVFTFKPVQELQAWAILPRALAQGNKSVCISPDLSQGLYIYIYIHDCVAIVSHAQGCNFYIRLMLVWRYNHAHIWSHGIETMMQHSQHLAGTRQLSANASWDHSLHGKNTTTHISIITLGHFLTTTDDYTYTYYMRPCLLIMLSCARHTLWYS